MAVTTHYLLTGLHVHASTTRRSTIATLTSSTSSGQLTLTSNSSEVVGRWFSMMPTNPTPYYAHAKTSTAGGLLTAIKNFVKSLLV